MVVELRLTIRTVGGLDRVKPDPAHDWNAAQDIFQLMMVATMVVGIINWRYLRREERGNSHGSPPD